MLFTVEKATKLVKDLNADPEAALHFELSSVDYPRPLDLLRAMTAILEDSGCNRPFFLQVGCPNPEYSPEPINHLVAFPSQKGYARGA
jgi:hypothetical protein